MLSNFSDPNWQEFDPFSPQGERQQQYRQQFRADRQRRLEERVMRRLLKRLGLERQVSELLELAQQATGQRQLRFVHFRELYPSFPAWLVVGRFTKLQKLSAVALLTSLNKTGLPARFEEVGETLPDCERRHLTLVVGPVLSLPGNFAVVYNHTDSLGQLRGPFVGYRACEEDPLLVLDSLDRYLRRLSRCWHP